MKQLATTENPFLSLPIECQQSVFKLWSAYRYMREFDDPMSIIAPIAIWFTDGRCDSHKLIEACRILVYPEVMEEIKYASDLMTRLARDSKTKYYDPLPFPAELPRKDSK